MSKTSIYKRPEQPNLSKSDLDRIKQSYGTNDLYIDTQGNVREKLTHAIVQPHRSIAEVQNEEKTALKEYFHKLPLTVKSELIKVALAHAVQQATENMSNFQVQPKDGQLWGLSYEEMAKMVSEGVLLGDD